MPTTKQRRTTEVPELLGDLIERVNLLPIEQNLPAIEYFFNLNELQRISELEIKPTDDYWLRFYYVTEGLPQKFLEYLWDDGQVPELLVEGENWVRHSEIPNFYKKLREAMRRYKQFTKLQSQFRFLTEKKIIEFLIDDKIWLQKKVFDDFSRFDIEETLNELPISPKFKISTDGKDVSVEVSLDEFSEAISDKKAKITRIRKCKECKKIFWAGRIDLFYCPQPSKCRNLFKARNGMRKKSPEKKLERIKNKIQQLKGRYMRKSQYTNNATLHFEDSESNIPNSKKLDEGQKVKINKIGLNSDKEPNAIRFFVETEEMEKGYIEVVYNNKFDKNLKQAFLL